jgi:tetratricopeptide (TPR) repeat protein
MAAILIAAIFLLSIVFIIFAGMKAKLFAIGLFLFALAACTHRAKAPEPVEGPTYELQSIDSLMWRHPDSALTRLLPWFDTCCRDAARHVSTATAYNRHYANLLLSELLYKNDYPQTNRRELQQAVAYFDSISQVPEPVEGPSNRIAFLDARAHYINGVGYYENDSVVEACKEYMKALEVMGDRFGEKELMGKMVQFVALTYTRLSMLFSDMYLHEQAIYFAQVSISYYHKTKVASWFLSRMLSEIGGQYDMMNQLDSAKHYYRNAAIVLNDTNSLVYRDIATHQVYLEYEISNQADTAIKALSYYLSVSNSLEEYLVRASVIGEIFYHERQFDSAWVYLSKVFEESERSDLKKQAAEWLVEICKAQNRISEMHEYAEFLVPFATQDEDNSVIKSQLTELYKAFYQSQHERQHEKEMQRHRNRSMAVIAGLFLVILVVLALYRNNKRRKQHLEKQIKEEKQTHSMEKKALSSRLKKSNETLRELQNKIKQQNKIISIKSETQATTFMDEPICRLILERVSTGQFKSKVDYLEYKTYALSKQQLIDLRVAVDQHFDKFTIRLKNTYPQLTNGDLDYCCLYLLGLTDADIAALMQRTYSTVSDRSRKLKTVFESPDTLSVTLHCIANEEITI